MSSYNKEDFISLETKIKNNVIPSMFPSLISEHQTVLSNCVFRIILAILICFNYDDKGFHQFEQNNYQDIKWITYLLLPYLNESENKHIVNFNDIYVSKNHECDINLQEPSYIHSNVQYNLFNRNSNGYVERQFTLEMFYQNYYLLINTIKTCANKLHTNWIDILPYTTNEIENSQLYEITYEKIQRGLMTDWNPVEDFTPTTDVDQLLSESFTKMIGLQVSDIYNTMSMYLYEEIVSVKWLIFDIVSADNIYPQIYVLNEIFDLGTMIAGISWVELTHEEKTKFTNIWEVLLEEAKSGNTVDFGFITLSNESVKSLLKSIIIFFNFGSSHVKSAKTDGYIEIQKSFDENGDEEAISYNDIQESLQSVDPKYIYEYMCSAIGVFSHTWYGTKILNSSKTAIKRPFQHSTNLKYNEFGKNIPITYKNIYNFSKSFINRTYIDEHKKSKISRYPLIWSSLDSGEKMEILNRLNGTYGDVDYLKWFNIKRYVRKLRLAEFTGLNSNNDSHVLAIHDALYKKLREIWAITIFEVLTMKGVLTKFVPNMYKTDQKFTIRDDIWKLQEDIFSTSDDNKYWKNAYHYLVSKPYCEMGNFNTRNGTYNYFTLAKDKKYQWYTAYSYDWIAQIGFCHHFTNNRVIFITGATGVGKSTEIPKLFLYYSKAVDYLHAPKIVCTQPRKAPTENNASYVSTTLGVPIFSYDENGKSTDTENYFIQMKHRDREHTSRERSHSVLEYATDGSLILQVNDPIGKITRGDNFTKENVYDIIMIDEAHEHKINMDLLLTYLKINIGFNNSMRLVILSATMDEDEPKYRRFYRDINDNRKYPLNMWLAENKLDRINIDRRFHISPPGMGTKYEVKDFYEPGETELGMVQRILKNSSEGDILIFQPGTADIKKLVIALNEITAPNIIAIPYHSQLSSETREFVENISETRKFLKISKYEDFGTSKNLTVGTNSYSRIIIVATNVAEASITIPSLKFVIETGTQKVQLYDYVKRGEKLVKTFISESSRVQRRGRVGRKASGSVYYLYEKGKMTNNKIICEISTNDISLQLFGKLKSNEIEKQFLQHDPNKYNTILTKKQLEDYKTNKLDAILRNQYFLGSTYFSYYGQESMYDYTNYEELPLYFESGFDDQTLYDSRGKFYIVHPNESDIVRNINGDIMGESDQAKQDKLKGLKIVEKKMISKKLSSFWKTLFDYMYVTQGNEQIVKTDFGKNMIALFEKLKLEDHSMFRALIFGLMLGKGEEILRLYTLYQILQYNPQNIFALDEKGKPRVAKIVYELKTSDSDVLLKILSDLHEYLVTIDIQTKADIQKYMNYLSENTTFGYTREDYAELLGPEDQYSSSLRKKIIPGSTKKIYKIIQDAITTIFTSEIGEKKQKIYDWASTRQLSAVKITDYMKAYIKLRTDINKNLSNEDREMITNLKSKLKLNDLPDSINRVTLSLLFGYPFNVCRKIQNSNYYMSVYVPSLNNMFQIGSSSMFKFKPIMLIEAENTQQYLMYLVVNIENNTIACLHKIQPELIMLLNNIYNNKYFATVLQEYNYVTDRETLTINNAIYQNNNSTVNLQNAMLNVTHTIKIFKHELIENKNFKFKITDFIL